MPDSAAPAPIGRLQTVVFDCPDPVALAEFYQRLLGGIVEVDPTETGPGGDGWVDLRIGARDGRLAFQRCTAYEPPEWPGRIGEQQIHLDIEVDDLEHAASRAAALGATLLAAPEGYLIYRDPVGHPFCLIPTAEHRR